MLARTGSQAEAWAQRITAHMRSVVAGPPLRVGTRVRMGTLRLRVSAASVHVESIHSGVVTWAGEASYASLEDLTDTVARLAAEPTRPCRRLTVTLERPVVQLRTLVDLPPVRAKALAALVAHQPARFFRKNGRPLVTDAVWVHDELQDAKTPRRKKARAAAVEEPVVESIVAGARAAGLRLDGITPAGEPTGLSLLPAGERASRSRIARVRLRRLALVAAVAWLAAGGLFLGRVTSERRRVGIELAAIEQPLNAVLAAKRELREAEATVLAVEAVARDRGAAASLLVAVARTLPDSAVITSLTWSAGGEGMFSGAARRAADVLARLERVRGFEGARFEGPIVREAIGGREWERFTILFGTRDSGLGTRDDR